MLTGLPCGSVCWDTQTHTHTQRGHKGCANLITIFLAQSDWQIWVKTIQRTDTRTTVRYTDGGGAFTTSTAQVPRLKFIPKIC